MYCVLRGIRPSTCYFQLSLFATKGAEKLHAIQIAGWLADPAHGQRPISAAVKKNLCTALDSSAFADLVTIKVDSSDNWLRAKLVLRADLKSKDETKAAHQ